MKKRKILYIASSIGLSINQSGGAGTHIRGTIQGFRENDVDVLPFIGGDIFRGLPSKKADEGPVKEDKPSSFRNIFKQALPKKIRLLLRDLRTVRQDYLFENKIIKRTREFSPDAIYERSGYLSTSGSRIAKKLGVPHFVESDGCMVEIINNDYGVFSLFIGNWIERKKLQSADYVVVMNERAIPEIATKFKLKEHKFLVKHLGVDFDAFNQDENRITELKRRYGIEGKFIVGFVGAISTYHGINYLIEAAAAVQKSNFQDIIFLIIGWSKEGEKLKRKAEEMGLKNIIFAGKVDKSVVSEYYRLFDVGVIPDAEEGIYPIKVLEYGKFGICPLAPDYLIFRDIIKEGESGYFFRPRDAHSLSENVLKIYKEREGIIDIGRNWMSYVKDNFQWGDTVKDVIKAIIPSTK